MAVKLMAFDPADYLDSDEARTYFLKDAFETGDPDYIAHAIGIIERAAGKSRPPSPPAEQETVPDLRGSEAAE